MAMDITTQDIELFAKHQGALTTSKTHFQLQQIQDFKRKLEEKHAREIHHQYTGVSVTLLIIGFILLVTVLMGCTLYNWKSGTSKVNKGGM